MKVNITHPRDIRRISRRLKYKVRLALKNKTRKAKIINKNSKVALQQCKNLSNDLRKYDKT